MVAKGIIGEQEGPTVDLLGVTGRRENSLFEGEIRLFFFFF